jgi:hypothetical protein
MSEESDALLEIAKALNRIADAKAKPPPMPDLMGMLKPLLGGKPPSTG